MKMSLSKLVADRAGNTLAIFAAALVPLTIMIGSGIDIAITYTAQAQLQNACDSAALAGRQAMVGSTWTSEAEEEARKYFNFNFPSGTYGVENASFQIDQDPNDGTLLLGSASGDVPTSIMNIFGYDSLEIGAACEARRDLGHNDVMLVLDVTGSMNGRPSTGGARKITRLRSGAMGLYRALIDEDNTGSITRYGIVSYSQSVNVGRSLTDNDIRDFTPYWSRYGYGTQFISARDSSWRSKQRFRTSGRACVEERPSIGNDYRRRYRIEREVTQEDIDARSPNGQDNDLMFGRYDPGRQRRASAVCPAEAMRLQEMDSEAAFRNAINRTTSRVGGLTYHDVGMLWGARFLSRTGMFASDNPSDRNGVPVNSHIVFMTDGQLVTSRSSYSAHGIERYQNRTGGRSSSYVLQANHAARFLSTCNTVRSMGITVWVIALDNERAARQVEPCATSPEHFYVSDGSDLEEVFEQIGQGIGSLRLTK